MARRLGRLVLVALGTLALSGTALAHGGGLANAGRESLTIPTWLFLATGGAVIGASFLLASFVTDRSFVESIHRWTRPVRPPGRLLVAAARFAAVGVLAASVVVGFVGPPDPTRNLAILVVWIAWWGGYVASTYLLGNSWPVLNPFRVVADALPSFERPYPDRLGAWPSVAGLLVLVFLEVVSPLAEDPRLLATVVVAYGLVTVAGSVGFGTDRWFETVDPVARLVRYYGRVAPLARTSDGVCLRLPGAALSETRLVTGRDEVAFVVAILFVTTFDGFVATALWRDTAEAAVGLGTPPLVVYLLAYLTGYAVFLGGYLTAAGVARRSGETYLTADALARRFAPSLLAIAAGYHLAHNLGSVVSLLPTLVAVVADPLSPPLNPVIVVLPSWFGALELAFVLLGHLLAVWVAHATAYDLFPGRLQAVRSQYGVTAAMVVYTMVSLWVVAEPYVPPPFL